MENSVIILLFKKCDEAEMSNYCPVSLTSNIGRNYKKPRITSARFKPKLGTGWVQKRLLSRDAVLNYKSINREARGI